MLSFRTQGFSACAVEYSPFKDDRIAVGASANYGLVGNGRLYNLALGPDGQVRCLKSIDTPDNINSLAWSELHDAQVAVACGDGKTRLYDFGTAQSFPVQEFVGHSKDVFSVSWGQVDKSLLCTGAWDNTIGVYTQDRSQPIVQLGDTMKIATSPKPEAHAVYSAEFAPGSAYEILSAHGEGLCKLWDIRSAGSQLRIPAVRNGDCLSAARNKYDQFRVATAGTDALVRTWDLRNASIPVSVLQGHQLTVKSLAWSPHSRHHLLSTSYDMTAKVWVDRGLAFAAHANTPPQPAPLAASRAVSHNFTVHTEFVMSGAWSLWGQPGWAATVGWDQMLYIWRGFDQL